MPVLGEVWAISVSTEAIILVPLRLDVFTRLNCVW
jgi:hypothetical protein